MDHRPFITPEAIVASKAQAMGYQPNAENADAGGHDNPLANDVEEVGFEADPALVYCEPHGVVCHSQELTGFDLQYEESCWGKPILPDTVAYSSSLPPQDWEYHAMMLEEDPGSELYPGMHNDASEFDGHDSGCLRQGRRCVMRIEDCIKCPSCATRACYSPRPLRPGGQHRKGVFRRCWASVKAKGSACIHPQFPHERYN